MQKLIEDDTKRPDVALGGVVLLVEDLGGHVDGTADAGLVGDGGVLDDLAEAEVADLEVAAVDEDVGGFEVAVDYVVPRQLLVPFYYLLHYHQHLRLRQTLLLTSL